MPLISILQFTLCGAQLRLTYFWRTVTVILLPEVMVTEMLLQFLICIVFFEEKSSRYLLCHLLMLSVSINNLLSWGVLQNAE